VSVQLNHAEKRRAELLVHRLSTGKCVVERTASEIGQISSFFHLRPLWFAGIYNGSFRVMTYSVIETGSKQYRVAAGDTLEVERLAVDAGQPFTFDRVLLVNNDGKVTVGSPTVASATVVADVVEHIRGEKKVAFKMKRRKGYHKTIGHRQELTVVKIKEIKA
jgi:large subunit ribosomal protein L21